MEESDIHIHTVKGGGGLPQPKRSTVFKVHLSLFLLLSFFIGHLTLSYPFTDPSVIPSTKYLCRNGYTISTGIIAINIFAESNERLFNFIACAICSPTRRFWEKVNFLVRS